jgi:hypothetical protein
MQIGFSFMQIITAFFDMEALKLSRIAEDPKGSYVMDAFFKSQTVGEKNKEKLLLKLKVSCKHLLDLAKFHFHLSFPGILCDYGMYKIRSSRA